MARYHHSALTRGYVSVKETEGIKEAYKGGYIPAWIKDSHQ